MRVEAHVRCLRAWNMAKQPDAAATPKPKPVEIILDEAEPDTLRPIGGSRSDRFNST